MNTATSTTRPPGRRSRSALASLLAIAGFTVLGSVFEYPQILEEPTADILALYREHQGTVMTWFLRARRQRRADGAGRHLARPPRRRHPRPLDRRSSASPRPRSRSSASSAG